MDGEQSPTDEMSPSNGKTPLCSLKESADAEAHQVPEMPARKTVTVGTSTESKPTREAPPQLLSELLQFENVRIDAKTKEVLVEVPAHIVGR